MTHSFRFRDAKIRVSDRQLLGSGGQADVYGFGDIAYKLYRGLTPEASERLRSKLQAFPDGMPEVLVGPLGLLWSASDPKVMVGYAMRRVHGAHPWHRLARRNWRAARLPMNRVMGYFRTLHDALVELHHASVVVGDLNDTNLLFGLGAPALPEAPVPSPIHIIDADSLQYAGFPCPVGHPRYVAPELFGEDLGASAKFSVETDWYAFGVLLFEAVMHMHPFGGVHPTVNGMHRRATARLSALDPAVKRPKVSTPLSCLRPEFLDYFIELFHGSERRAPSPGLLEGRWSRCPSCGLETQTHRCHCDGAEPPKPSHSLPYKGRGSQSPRRHRHVFARRVAGTDDGRLTVLSASAPNGRLYFLTFDGRHFAREDGRTLAAAANTLAGLKIELTSTQTWMGIGAKLIGLADGSGPASSSSATFETETSAAVVGDHLIALVDDRIIDVASRRTLGMALSGRTWLGGGSTHGIAVQALSSTLLASVFGVEQPGLTELQLPGAVTDALQGRGRGKLRGVEGHTRGSWVLLELCVDGTAGPWRHRMVFALNGKLQMHQKVPASDTGGACLAGDRLLWPTDQGICSTSLLHPSAPPTLLSATAPFVSAEHRLLPGPDRTLYVVAPHRIDQLHQRHAPPEASVPPT